MYKRLTIHNVTSAKGSSYRVARHREAQVGGQPGTREAATYNCPWEAVADEVQNPIHRVILANALDGAAQLEVDDAFVLGSRAQASTPRLYVSQMRNAQCASGKDLSEAHAHARILMLGLNHLTRNLNYWKR